MKWWQCFPCVIVMALGAIGCAPHSNSSPLVALVTDYGSRDAYAGALAGSVLTECPRAQVVDISHEVPKYDIRSGSFVLSVASEAFPSETVFCVVIDPGVGTDRRSIIVRTRQKKWFVGPDNGTFTEVIDRQGLAGAWNIDAGPMSSAAASNTFHGRDIYGPVAGMLAAGIPPDQFGAPIDDPITLDIAAPRRVGDRLIGEVRRVDGYGNMITNIPGKWIDPAAFAGQRAIMVTVGGQTHQLPCGRTYADAPPGELIGLVNSLGVFEIARNRASAADAMLPAGSDLEVVVRLRQR